MNRKEHLDWCKKRALEYANRNDLQQAYASMMSDLNKHDGTRGHPAMTLGMGLMFSGLLSSKQDMIKFIEGFN